MRGEDKRTGSLFSFVDLEAKVPSDHPLRLIREIVNDVLEGMSADFEAIYSDMGRPGIPPEHLIRASLLQAFYTIRSERQLMTQIDYNMLFRWFIGLGIDDPIWVATVFTKNRDRLMAADVSAKFLAGIVAHERVKGLLSHDHFSVDGTMIEAWASMKGFRRKDGSDDDTPGDSRGGGSPSDKAGRNRERNFRKHKRTNATHHSTTDPEARLHRKGNGKESKLCFMGHALMENRNGLAVGVVVTLASGTAEREAALDLMDTHCNTKRRKTLAGDKGYDVEDFVLELRKRKITPHIAVQDHLSKTGKRRKTKIDGRTTRHRGYKISQRHRKRVEELFGWTKVVAGQAKTKFRGRRRVEASFTLAMAACNLMRLPKLLADPPR